MAECRARTRSGTRGTDASTSRGGGRRTPVVARRWRIGEVPAAYLLLAPVLVLFAFAVVYPLFDTIRLSFFDIKGL